ncbi:MAG: DUF917 domain-containing protein [Nocardiopsaceae bacterium]|jgi:DUF917 family protein|nr:DUF917 domain-containing protein [Nocardiopsaceae bacterium]
MQLTGANLPVYALGCAIASSGGGGSTKTPLAMALRAVEELGPVDVVDVGSLEPDGMVMPVGLIGAPMVATERVWSGEEAFILREQVETLCKAPVVALMCYEIGGSNGLLPVTWAARLGLPLLDADGMGRAFPEMQQQSMHLSGVPASPMVLTDGCGEVAVLWAATNYRAERLARRAMGLFGGACAAAAYPMTAGRAATAVIRGSVSRAFKVGGSLRLRAMERIAAITQAVGGAVLLEGKIIELTRESDSGFVRGAAIVAGLGQDANRLIRLEMQNEVLLALEDGELLAMVPDIISVIGSDTCEPLPTEGMRLGQRVTIVAHPSPPVWTTPEGLNVAGPRAFGLPFEYAPICGMTAHAR